MSKHKPSAVRFFFKAAGYSWNPKTETKIQGRWRGARELAAAEKRAKELGLTIVWEYDEDPDTSWMDAEQLADLRNGSTEMLCCYVFKDAKDCGRCESFADYTRHHWVRPEILASLSGIHTDVDDKFHYRRVVGAELAMEALATLEEA